ncbi:histone-lysine N-methyltransferase Suv4-20-like [Lethenteron reissneri]|uniref:histone-lysine N-methyltransferase Suv4-20-like n=1 Tax=Lethenteron reissneri TaxID=7753 RepID=UPI002AB60CDF|nr:histone-lysine N-methyltransferase Suv4-20-like [Lethenteron reissneri]
MDFSFNGASHMPVMAASFIDFPAGTGTFANDEEDEEEDEEELAEVTTVSSAHHHHHHGHHHHGHHQQQQQQHGSGPNTVSGAGAASTSGSGLALLSGHRGAEDPAGPAGAGARPQRGRLDRGSVGLWVALIATAANILVIAIVYASTF